MGTDCKVKHRRYETVGEEVRKVRRWLGIDAYYTFDITKQIEFLVGRTIGQLGVLHLDLFKYDAEDLAWVSFKPRLTLHVHQEIWMDARLGEPKSRFILAHELGHIFLHGHYRQAFSHDGKGHLKAWPEEERAEPQANWFAEQFLAPDHLAGSCKDQVSLCQQFDFPEMYAADRMSRLKSRRASYVGEACPECGNFTVVRNGTNLKCETCGTAIRRS
ncbi:MAG TPA: ImmA/IrrE family metallo-endopeptidase [Methylocystis sp.]|jgi:ribosomal protein S27E